MSRLPSGDMLEKSSARDFFAMVVWILWGEAAANVINETESVYSRMIVRSNDIGNILFNTSGSTN